MAHPGYAGGYVPTSGYPQQHQFANSNPGIAPGRDYSPLNDYTIAGAPVGNSGYSGHSDSTSPAPSGNSMINSSSSFQNNIPGYPNHPAYPSGNHGNSTGSYSTIKGSSMSPSPSGDAQPVEYKWWIPSEGISRTVMQKNIQHFLGPEAVSKVGSGRGEDEDVPGYWIAAWTTLTPKMILDLKEMTEREKKEKKAPAKRPRQEPEDPRRDRFRDRDSGGRFDRDPPNRGAGYTPPPKAAQPGYDQREYSQQQNYAGSGFPPPPPPQADHYGGQYQTQQYPPQGYPPNAQYSQYPNAQFPNQAYPPQGQGYAPPPPQYYANPPLQSPPGHVGHPGIAQGDPNAYAGAYSQAQAGHYPPTSGAPPGYYYGQGGQREYY